MGNIPTGQQRPPLGPCLTILVQKEFCCSLWSDVVFALDLQVLVNLEEGVGVSLVNKVPEELVFVTLSGIRVHFTRTTTNEVLEVSVQRIQVSW